MNLADQIEAAADRAVADLAATRTAHEKRSRAMTHHTDEPHPDRVSDAADD